MDSRHKVPHQLRAITLNPLTIAVVIVLLGLFGWNHYVSASRNLDRPMANILPDPTFSTVSTNGNPLTDWTVIKHGDMGITGGYSAGYATDRSLTVNVVNYKNGNVDITSPEATLQTNKKYLFKSFYKSTHRFELLARYGYRDGSSQLVLIQSYPPSGMKWTTASSAFTSGPDITSVQFIMRASSNGSTTLNETYLEPDNSAYIAPTPVSSSANLIQNSALQADDTPAPTSWTPEANGSNDTQSGIIQSATRRSLYMTTSNYKNGSATWQPAALPVQPGQYFTFRVDYQSNVSADIVATFQQADKTYHFVTIENLEPASAWTTVTANVEVPNQAVMLSVSVVLHHQGTVRTSNYSLYNISGQKPLQWKQPLVSLTFDGGWESEYQNALSALNRFKDPATFYVNPATIGTNDFMGTLQLAQLIHAHDELALQGYDYTDLTTINSGQITTETQAGQQYLTKTFQVPITDFAAPYGNTDAQVQTILRQYFRSNRGGIEGINTKQNFDPYNLRVLYIGSHTTLSQLQSALDMAKQYNGWLILTYSQIGSSGANGMVTPKHLSQQLQAIQKSGLAVQTVSSALGNLEH